MLFCARPLHEPMTFHAARPATIVLHQDVHLHVELLPGFGAMVNTWQGFVQGAAYRERMDRCLELLQSSGADTVIANVQALRPLLAEDQTWTNEDWAPRASALGLKRMGVVVPTTVFAQLAVTRIVRRLDQISIHTAEFGELPDALRWLESLDR